MIWRKYGAEGGHTVTYGDLAVKFMEEVISATSSRIDNNCIVSKNATRQSDDNIVVDAQGAIRGTYMEKIPYNCHITIEMEPNENNNEYDLFLKCNDKTAKGYILSFSPNRQTAQLHDAHIDAVPSLGKNIGIVN
jgi:hypothetical protein